MPDKNRYARIKASGKLATPEARAKHVAGTKRWRDKNPEKHKQHMVGTRQKLKAAIIAAYGGKCICCGEDHSDFLTVEHKNGGGRKHREGRGTYGVYRDIIRAGFPADYTILCMNCNHAKRYDRPCPHTTRTNPLDDLVKALEQATELLETLTDPKSQHVSSLHIFAQSVEMIAKNRATLSRIKTEG